MSQGIFGLSDARNTTIHKFGVNLDVDAAEDIWTQGGTYPFPAAAAATNIISTDVDDDGDPVDTGARTVFVEGLDTNYLPISETAIMDGTTQVVLDNEYLRIQRAWVVASGASGTNEGTINIRHGATVIGQIAIGKAQSEMALFTVPSDTRGALLHQFEFNASRSAAATNTADIQLEFRLIGETFRVHHPIRIRTDGAQYLVPITFPLYLPPRTDIRIRAAAVSAANSAVFGAFDLELIAVEARHLPNSAQIM